MDALHALPVHNMASHGQTRTAWTAQEDAILRARVAAIGAGAGLWPEVAKGLPGRTSKSCAERWQTHLNPAYVRSSEQEFSDWEIAVMILAYARHGSNWLKVSEFLPMRSPQNIKNQVNYFNAKPEHVRDNRFLAARIELEDLLAAEPEIVKQRRQKLQEVLVKGQSALPAGALQAAYAAAKLSPPNLGNNSGSRLHPYARPTSLQASYGMQAIGAYQAAPMQHQQQAQMQPQQQPQASPPSMSAMNAMMLLAQAACGDDEVQEDAAAAAAAAPVPEGMLKSEQEDMQQQQQASQHGVAGLQLPMIQTRPLQHSLLQENGSGGSSSSFKQPGSNAAQMWSYPSGMQTSSMSMLMPGLMAMQGAQDSPMASSQGQPLPASAAAALATAHKAGTSSPASTPLAALDNLAASAGLSASEFAAIAAATAGAMPRPSKSGSSQGTRRRASKAASKYGDFMNGDDMSTSEEGEGEETGDLTPLAQRVAEAAAAAVSAATQQAVTATQQACQVLSMAQMLAQQAQQAEAKPAASDRSSQPSGGENGSEQQMIDAAVTQRLNNQHSGEKAAGLAAAAVAAAAAGTAAAHRLDDAVRHLLEAHYEKMQQLQQQLQQELQEQLATLGKLHTVA